MSRQVIAELELALDKVLTRYETEYEITVAEMCGILGILSATRSLKAVIEHNSDELRELLREPHLTLGAAPTGELITLEGDEPGEINHDDNDD